MDSRQETRKRPQSNATNNVKQTASNGVIIPRKVEQNLACHVKITPYCADRCHPILGDPPFW